MTGTKRKTKKKENKVAKVHQELAGLDVRVNRFGELTSSIDVDKLNEFLDKNVEDKKLKDR